MRRHCWLLAEDVELAVEEGLPTKSGLFFLGTGALADGVRRSYDGQIEASLRSSLSDLEAQQPLIEQTQRLINVFGNKNASLTPALGSFFDSMRSLSVDASSEILRNQVLNEGQTLASRFNTLAVQLDDIDLETQLQSEQQAKNFNALSEQLAIVNGNLQRVSDINKQPSNLLDTRDQVLRDMLHAAVEDICPEAKGKVGMRPLLTAIFITPRPF